MNSVPYRYSWNFAVPQTMATFSMVEYRVSLGCNFLLANAIGLFSPALSSWRRTAVGGFGIGAVRKDKDVDRLFERRPLPVLTGGE